MSSSPVDITVIRGLGRAVTVPRPAEQAYLHRAHPCSRRQQHVAYSRVAAGPPDRVPGLGGAADRDVRAAAIGPLHGDDGVRAGRHRRTGHDPQAGPLVEMVRPGVAGRDLAAHRQRDRPLRRGRGDVGGQDRVPVHARVVERRQRPGRGDVLGEHRAAGLVKPELTRRQRPDGRENVVQVALYRLHRSLPGVLGNAHQRLSR
jgi:hypothetical protein